MRILIDTREQAPLDFSRWPGVTVEVGTLNAGDYSLRGLEDRFALERKSISDLVGSVTTGRERLNSVAVHFPPA
jgi:ERCC4-type nuclease